MSEPRAAVYHHHPPEPGRTWTARSRKDAAVEALMADVAGFGPSQRYLDDPEVEEF